jgi:hypothetical protein
MMVNPALPAIIAFLATLSANIPQMEEPQVSDFHRPHLRKAVKINHNDSHQEKMNVKEDDA